ncbi:hypothetical protein [Candidatus Poriferisocius sp.]|uniref:hypothetical protein n=1 Tax=Candidatus Poriferisocius sp. TaxID=3101276 RepID=UPI003B014885
MDVMAAVVWHWWIALLLVLGTVPLVIATIVGYVTKVIGPRYGPRQPRNDNAGSNSENNHTEQHGDLGAVTDAVEQR